MYSDVAKHQALDAITIDRMSLHSGDPGVNGTANEISGNGYTRQACSFNAAAAGARVLGAAVDFVGPASQVVTWVGLWLNAGTVFKGAKALTGDQAMNAAGEYRVTTATQLTIDDV